MKLIMENWRRYLKEQEGETAPAKPGAKSAFHDIPTAPTKKGVEPSPSAADDMATAEPSGDVQKHNVEALFRMHRSDRRVWSIFWEGYKGPGTIDDASTAHQFISYLVVKNKIFHTNKIVDYLGGGSFGFVVQLDNDHALKIFIGSFDPIAGRTDPAATSDIERYKTSHEKAFKGAAKAGELMIYEEGELETPFDKKWFYAEMPQLKALSDEMRSVWADKKPYNMSDKEVTTRIDNEILFLKELAHLANLVEKHGAQAFKEFDPEEAYAQLGPDEKPGINLGDCCMWIDARPRGDEPTEIAEFADLLERENLETIFNTVGYKGHPKIALLDKKYAENLFMQLKGLLKDKTLKDITDVRGANVGVSTQDESLPIIFDM